VRAQREIINAVDSEYGRAGIGLSLGSTGHRVKWEPEMYHGEYKTVGGKLVIADFEVANDQFQNVSISGDFFLEPAEALEQINQALEGLPAESPQDVIATTILGSLGPEVEMIGFSPEAVAIAVRRGVDGA
jgi:lipoate---protein ligase